MKVLDGFELVRLEEKDAVVQERLDAFYERLGLAKPWHHPALRWLGFAKDGVVSLVVAVWPRPDNSLEVTDFFPAPTRDGVRAGYAGLNLLRLLVDEGIIKEWIGGIVYRNKSGQRRAERYFGIEPASVVYRYGRAT